MSEVRWRGAGKEMSAQNALTLVEMPIEPITRVQRQRDGGQFPCALDRAGLLERPDESPQLPRSEAAPRQGVSQADSQVPAVYSTRSIRRQALRHYAPITGHNISLYPPGSNEPRWDWTAEMFFLILSAMKILLSITVCLLGLAWCAAAADDAPKKQTQFEIIDREGGTLTATNIAGTTTFIIRGGSGIGGGTVRRILEQWPKEIVVRSYLNGMESFAISDSHVELAVSVLSHSDNQQLLHLRKDGKEGPQLGKDSPYWMEVRMFNAEGKPVKGLPPSDGWFELVIPKALLGESKELTLSWIDFYRQ